MQLDPSVPPLDNMIDKRQFRNVIQQFSSTVVVITVADGDEIHGMTATSFAVVSFQSPSVLVCIRQSCRTHQMVMKIGHFAVNVLHDEQWSVSERFAGRLAKSEDRFSGLSWHRNVTGSPILSNCLAWLDCLVVSHYCEGDHTIFVGKVLAGDTNQSGEPLQYYKGTYLRLMEAGKDI